MHSLQVRELPPLSPWRGRLRLVPCSLGDL